MVRDERSKALDLALSQIEKDLEKKRSCGLAKSTQKQFMTSYLPVPWPLDIAIGIGGIPRGRVIEIFGPESSGKTTSPLCMVAQAQKKAELPPTSTLNTRWIRNTRKNWAFK